MAIHPTAIVDKGAEIDPSAEIGAYAIVEPGAKIGPGVRLYPHAYVATGATLEAGVQVHPFAVVGHLPQDLAYTGAATYAVIGEGTIIREGASVHRGTAPGSTTIVGKRCFMMANSHVGHNCRVGDDVKMANCALLAGHVSVGSGAFLSGGAGVHQFVRIGELVMIGNSATILNDVPPFMMVITEGVVGPNVVGQRRAGISPAARQEIRHSHRLLYRMSLPFPRAVAEIVAMVKTDEGRRLAEFLQAPSKRGFAIQRIRHHAVPEVHDAVVE